MLRRGWLEPRDQRAGKQEAKRKMRRFQHGWWRTTKNSLIRRLCKNQEIVDGNGTIGNACEESHGDGHTFSVREPTYG